jgi:hypothetical protein
MSTKSKTEGELIGATARVGGAGGERSEPGGRALRAAGAARSPQGPPPVGLPPEVRDRLSDEVTGGGAPFVLRRPVLRLRPLDEGLLVGREGRRDVWRHLSPGKLVVAEKPGAIIQLGGLPVALPSSTKGV